MYVRLTILKAVNNGLGLMAGDIKNALYMAPCDENIWSWGGADFGTIWGALVVLK